MEAAPEQMADRRDVDAGNLELQRIGACIGGERLDVAEHRGQIRVVERGDRSRSGFGDEGEPDRRSVAHEEVGGAGLGQPVELVVPAREVEDGTLDLGDRRQGGRIGADRLGCQVGGFASERGRPVSVKYGNRATVSAA